MSQTLTIARRELASLFYSPIAYIVIALFAFGTTLIFFSSFTPDAPATMRPTFEAIVWFMIFLVPAVSMRLISEEYRAGTIEPLMTSPIDETKIVLGKWLGALAFFAALLLPVVVLIGVLQLNSSPDYGPILTGLAGLLLVGGLYLAIGTFASATTQNQIIAFLLAIFIICLFTIALYFLPRSNIAEAYPGIKQAMFYLNVNMQFEAFNKGLIDTSNFVYFASGTAFFLFLAVLVLQSRRWR